MRIFTGWVSVTQSSLKYIVSLFFVILGQNVHSNISASKPLALIYKGPGSCLPSAITTGCSEASLIVAELAGFKVQFIGPEDHVLAENLTKKINTKIWIQPGGRARIQAKSMSPLLKSVIKKFIAKGGGYIGFCAGGFLATETFGWKTKNGDFEANGFGFFKGKSHYFNFYDDELSKDMLAKVISSKWLDREKYLYWELGPYFLQHPLEESSEVVAYYNEPEKNKYILSMRGKYLKGKVFISATHPEAPLDWRSYYNLVDPDGEDLSDAVNMLRWVVK